MAQEMQQQQQDQVGQSLVDQAGQMAKSPMVEQAMSQQPTE